jgi:hypothetical protein
MDTKTKQNKAGEASQQDNGNHVGKEENKGDPRVIEMVYNKRVQDEVLRMLRRDA